MKKKNLQLGEGAGRKLILTIMENLIPTNILGLY